MKCVCGARAYCIDSRPDVTENATYRRYSCKKCDYRFSTCELIVGDLALNGTKSVMQTLREKIKQQVITEAIASLGDRK